MNFLPKNIYFDDILEDVTKTKSISDLKCNIYEKDGMYNIEMDSPGFKKEDISIDFNDGYITIKATNNTSRDEEHKNYIRKERSSSEYLRQFYLGNIDSTAIKAKLEDGLLKIEVPKKEELNNKKHIEIE